MLSDRTQTMALAHPLSGSWPIVTLPFHMKYQITSFYEGKCQQLTPQVIFHLVNLLWRELYKPTKKILYKEVNKTVLRVALSITSAFLVIVWCKVVAFSSYFSTWLHMQCNRMCGTAIKTRLLESDISAITFFYHRRNRKER